ncbi:protein DDI1 homolog 2-like isoform X2 [Gordionus sp. m RMFG-2023]
MHNNILLDNINNQTKLTDKGIKNCDLIIVIDRQKKFPNTISEIDFSNIQLPKPSTSSNYKISNASTSKISDPNFINLLKTHFLNNPNELAMLQQRNPGIVEALLNNDSKKFNSLIQEFMQHFSSNEHQSMMYMNEDSLNPEMQEKIAKLIHQKNIDVNMEIALEHTPESFGIVSMLYINIKVNDIPIKAFVDTGAQSTLMSKECAERCNLLRLADKRWAGIAKGVGVQNIIGRIHLTQMVIENAHIACSFSILENQPMDVLLGLDILRRYQCVIDLKDSLLKITTYGVSTPFLAESELPLFAQHLDLDDGGICVGDIKQGALKLDKMAVNRLPSENAIKSLTDMGFSREIVIKELKKCDGDIDQAANNLSKFL